MGENRQEDQWEVARARSQSEKTHNSKVKGLGNRSLTHLFRGIEKVLEKGMVAERKHMMKC